MPSASAHPYQGLHGLYQRNRYKFSYLGRLVPMAITPFAAMVAEASPVYVWLFRYTSFSPKTQFSVVEVKSYFDRP